MGWIIALCVVAGLAWIAVICYEIANPGKLNWNQPSWLLRRRDAGDRPRRPPGTGT